MHDELVGLISTEYGCGHLLKLRDQGENVKEDRPISLEL